MDLHRIPALLIIELTLEIAFLKRPFKDELFFTSAVTIHPIMHTPKLRQTIFLGVPVKNVLYTIYLVAYCPVYSHIV
jgi:hypothetical protein